MNTILFGFKGCGKTHFGKLLADKLGLPFVDTDDLIVQLYGKKGLTVREVYEQIGEVQFRLFENQAVQSLKEVKNSIIALGAGAILNPLNRKLIEKLGKLVYLETSLETLIKRHVNPAAGPIEPLYHLRLHLYREIPAVQINTDGCTESEILEKLHVL